MVLTVGKWVVCDFCDCPTPDIKAHKDECYSNPANIPCALDANKMCECAKWSSTADRHLITLCSKCQVLKHSPVVFIPDSWIAVYGCGIRDLDSPSV